MIQNNNVDEFYTVKEILESAGVDMASVPDSIINTVSDIHLSCGSKVTLFCSGGKVVRCGERVYERKDIQDIFYKLCGYSVYRHINEIRKGFITVADKYRCGICGTSVRRNGEITAVRDITSLNFRIPRMIKGAADELLSRKVDLLDGLLVVGEPSSGKTTILRDIICQLAGQRIAVVDERRELTGAFDFPDADIFLEYSKADAISQAIRTMSPDYILCDELDAEDLDSLRYGVSSGVSFIASVHGSMNSGEIGRKLVLDLLRTGAFGAFAVLCGRDRPGIIKCVVNTDEYLKTCGMHNDTAVWGPDRIVQSY